MNWSYLCAYHFNLSCGTIYYSFRSYTFKCPWLYEHTKAVKYVDVYMPVVNCSNETYNEARTGLTIIGLTIINLQSHEVVGNQGEL